SDEPEIVDQATPLISTTDNGDGGVVGESISDSATVSGGYNPTGTVTFRLYSSGTVQDNTTLLFTDANEALSGGTASSTSYTTTTVSTFYWVATYNGNATDNSVSSGATDEAVTTIKASPKISTTPGGTVAA